MKRMNKRGDERVLIFYWFIMFIIIAVGVSSGVIIFYGKSLDLREKEANILADKILECFIDKGNIKQGVLESINADNLAGKCEIYFTDNSHELYKGNQQYYVSVKVSGEKEYNLVYGNADFKEICNAAKSKIKIPVCAEKKALVLDSKGQLVSMNILVSVRKIEQNALY